MASDYGVYAKSLLFHQLFCYSMKLLTYLYLWPSHQQTYVLVLFTRQQSHRLLPILHLYTIDLNNRNICYSPKVKIRSIKSIKHKGWKKSIQPGTHLDNSVPFPDSSISCSNAVWINLSKEATPGNSLATTNFIMISSDFHEVEVHLIK